MNCLKCNFEISNLVMDYNNINEIIVCPNCSHPMIVKYDEDYDEETNEENCYWWVEEVDN